MDGRSVGAEGLTVFYDDQCPYSLQRVEGLSAFCTERGTPLASFTSPRRLKPKHSPAFSITGPYCITGVLRP